MFWFFCWSFNVCTYFLWWNHHIRVRLTNVKIKKKKNILNIIQYSARHLIYDGFLENGRTYKNFVLLSERHRFRITSGFVDMLLKSPFSERNRRISTVDSSANFSVKSPRNFTASWLSTWFNALIKHGMVLLPTTRNPNPQIQMSNAISNMIYYFPVTDSLNQGQPYSFLAIFCLSLAMVASVTLNV